MNINIELLQIRYEEMKSKNIDEKLLDEKIKNIKVFINKKPSNLLFNLKIAGDDVYIGSN